MKSGIITIEDGNGSIDFLIIDNGCLCLKSSNPDCIEGYLYNQEILSLIGGLEEYVTEK
jgi:hypothetical protein